MSLITHTLYRPGTPMSFVGGTSCAHALAERGAQLVDLPAQVAEPVPVQAPPAEKPQLVRVKTFEVVRMSNEEAVEQMELLSHDFYVFRDEDNGKMQVAYRRKSGGYGILRPEN